MEPKYIVTAIIVVLVCVALVILLTAWRDDGTKSADKPKKTSPLATPNAPATFDDLRRRDGSRTGTTHSGFERASMLRAQVEQAHQLGTQLLNDGRLWQAELHFEQAAFVARELMAFRPNDNQTRWLLAVSLANQAEALSQLGANPETEQLLIEAAALFRRIAEDTAGSTQAKVPLAETLIRLAKTYRGHEYYVNPRGSPVVTVEDMRTYRRERIQAGGWRGPLLGMYSPEWRQRAEAPLLESIRLFRDLSFFDAGRFAAMHALALNLLGDMYVNNERAVEAIDPLRKAESIYRQLVAGGDSDLLELLDDTRLLLSDARNAIGESTDRVGDLEQLASRMREQARISPEERRTGVTMSKANARDKYRKTLEELAGLYEAAGREEDSRALWDGDLGTMMVESLPIRRE